MLWQRLDTEHGHAARSLSIAPLNDPACLKSISTITLIDANGHRQPHPTHWQPGNFSLSKELIKPPKYHIWAKKSQLNN